MQKRNPRTRASGFTLIELMVVIVILGIMGAAAYSFFGGATADAEYNRADGEIRNMVDNIKLYYQRHNRNYPESLDQLNEFLDGGLNLEDPWGNPYEYTLTDDSFELWTNGALEDTEDDNIWADKREVINGYQDNYVSQGKSIE